MSAIDLDAIQARTEQATPGPWDAPETLLGLECTTVFSGVEHVLYHTSGRNDAQFIAFARTDVPALVARVRELESLLADVTEAHS